MARRDTSVIDFTKEEVAEFRILLRYADEHQRNRLSTADIDRLSTLDPYLYPVTHCARMSACLDIDNDIDGSVGDTDESSGLNEKAGAGLGRGSPSDSVPFAWRRGRLRRFLRTLVQMMNKRSRG